jgi:ABC-2 type transport system ATP-binding protein
MVFATRKAGRTIFFTTHILTDVERVADHVGVLDAGVLRAQAPLEAFLGRIRQYALRFSGDPPPAPQLPGLLQCVRGPRDLRITLVHAGEGVPPALSTLGAAAVEETALGFEDACIEYLRGPGSLGIGGSAEVL